MKKSITMKIIAVLMVLTTAISFGNKLNAQSIISHVDIKKTTITPTLDGFEEQCWNVVGAIPIVQNFVLENPTVNAYWKAMWADNGMYVLVSVQDNDHYPAWEAGSSQTWMYDNTEVAFDVNAVLDDGLGAFNGLGHYQYSGNFVEELYGRSVDNGLYTFANQLSGENRITEYFFPFDQIQNKNGNFLNKDSLLALDAIGFDVYVVDQDEDILQNRHRKVWQNTGTSDENWANMDDAGTIKLLDEQLPLPTQVMVTFRVDMSDELVSSSGVFLSGSFNAWGAPYAMTNTYDQVYEISLLVDKNTEYQYKYSNDDVWESPEGDCNPGIGNTNRELNAITENIILDLVCFNLCTACPPSHVDVQKTTLAPDLDGIIDAVWANFDTIPITKNYVGESPTVEAYWKTMWDNNGIYVLIDVQDNDHYPSWETGSTETWMYDQVEIFFDVNGNLKDGLGPNVNQGHYGYSPTFFDGGYDGTVNAGLVSYGNKLYEEGYVSEMFFPYSCFVNKDGQTMSKTSFLMLGSIGFDVQIVDRDEEINSVRARKVWQNKGLINENYFNMDDAGTIRLVGEDPYTDTRNDSLALVALYNSTGGENWTRKANWLTGPLSTWDNVTVQNGRVVVLNFGWNNNMVGTLPTDIGNLTAIKWFVAPSNEGLTGIIPSSIGNLTNLENLSFYNCDLRGYIPEVILNLNKLETIELSNNNFDAAPMPDFGQLSQLATLYIDNCNFTGDIPASLSNLTHLVNLSMSNNQGLNAGPIPDLSASPILYYIGFGNCTRTGNIPAWLSSSTNLGEINLGNNQLDGTIPQGIGSLTNLQYLYLESNELTGAIPSGLSNLSNLRVLYVNGNELSGDVPEITGLTQLNVLRVNNNKFTFANMAAFDNLPASLTDFGYTPQDTLLGIQKEGNLLTALDCGHANNYIRWYRDGSLISSNAPTCETDETGNYYYTVTNSDYNLLTLYSDTLYVDLAAIPIDLSIPSATVASGTEECFNAENDITVAGTGLVVIQEDATATFIAGNSIRFLPGFHAESGSNMHAKITTDGSFCDVAGGGSVVAQPEIKSTELAESNMVSITANQLQVKVYPNPSSGKFTIELNDTEPDITAIIYDLSGSTISRTTSYNTNQLSIELSGIRKGIYFLRIMSGTKQFGRKIIIK
jgi:Leucine-rich repeat (LRR) protein